MAEKEERIYIRGYGEDNPCDTCEDTSGEECDFCMENYEWNASIPRKEAIGVWQRQCLNGKGLEAEGMSR